MKGKARDVGECEEDLPPVRRRHGALGPGAQADNGEFPTTVFISVVATVVAFGMLGLLLCLGFPQTSPQCETVGEKVRPESSTGVLTLGLTRVS